MKTLLLNSTYQPIAFISERKAFKLFVKEKVEVMSSWDKFAHWGRGKMKIPSIIRLKYYVRWIPSRARFNRLALFKRDNGTCQYCGKRFGISDLTVDHIVPSSRGGKTTWQNCITSCYSCNNKKSDKTPEEADMVLLSKPTPPKMRLISEYWQISKHHPDWDIYLKT